jgi:hypothetical protein
MYCMASGDPHYRVFSGYTHHFQGIGEYVFTQSLDKDFSVHTCLQQFYPNSIVTTHRGVAVKVRDAKGGHHDTFVVRSDCHIQINGAMAAPGKWHGHNVVKTGNLVTMNFQGGEKVKVRCYGRNGRYAPHQTLEVFLPSAKYCDQVEGLCGYYSPAQQLANTYTTGDGSLVAGWGGWGDLPRFQKQFGETYKVPHKAKVFQKGCWAKPPPAVATPPFDGCPALKTWAQKNCCPGKNYDSCFDDIGQTCNKGKWASEYCKLDEEMPKKLPDPPVPKGKRYMVFKFKCNKNKATVQKGMQKSFNDFFGQDFVAVEVSVAKVQRRRLQVALTTFNVKLTVMAWMHLERVANFVKNGLNAALKKMGLCALKEDTCESGPVGPLPKPCKPQNCVATYVDEGICTKTCDMPGCEKTNSCAQQWQARKIITPASCGGTCKFAARKPILCRTKPPSCRVDCKMSGWSAFGEHFREDKCSKTCGTGSKRRHRSIVTLNNAIGTPCPDNNIVDPDLIGRPRFSKERAGWQTVKKACNTFQCPIDAICSKYTSWSEIPCSEQCGGGYKSRTKSVISAAAFGGKKCTNLIDPVIKTCNTHPCSANCVFEWKAWTPCDKSCGGGIQESDAVIKAQAKHGGMECPASRSRICNTHVCPTPSPTLSPTPAPTPPPTPAKSCPKIFLAGSLDITLEASTTGIYTEPAGAVCNDTVWSDITDRIVFPAAPAMNKLGQHMLTYTCRNPVPWKCQSKAKRQVHIMDRTRPVCTVKGDATVSIEASFPYVDEGATCSDTFDGMKKVKSSGTVDPNIPGTYKLTYTAMDKVGNHAKDAIRTVIVQDTLKPVIALKYQGKLIHTSGGKDTGVTRVSAVKGWNKAEPNPASNYFGRRLMADTTTGNGAWALAGLVASIAGLALVAYATKSSKDSDLGQLV